MSKMFSKKLTDSDIKRAESFRKANDTAILVIFFLDMVNSTKLRERMGEVRFEQERRRVFKKLISIIEKNDQGKVVKFTGDGLLGVFNAAGSGVERSIEIQRELIRSKSEFQFRIGLDMGQVSLDTSSDIASDVFGRHVNRASRIESMASGGHILTSYTVWDSAFGWLKHIKSILWRDQGFHKLKGLGDICQLFEPYDKRYIRPLNLYEKSIKTQKPGLYDFESKIDQLLDQIDVDTTDSISTKKLERLVVMSFDIIAGPRKGESIVTYIDVNKGARIGRSDVEITLKDQFTSRRHAWIVFMEVNDALKAFIIDTGSTGGTYVNGKKLTPLRSSKGRLRLTREMIMKKGCHLQLNDKIRIAKNILEVKEINFDWV